MVALEAGEDADALDALGSLTLDEDSEEGTPTAAKAKRKGKVCSPHLKPRAVVMLMPRSFLSDAAGFHFRQGIVCQSWMMSIRSLVAMHKDASMVPGANHLLDHEERRTVTCALLMACIWLRQYHDGTIIYDAYLTECMKGKCGADASGCQPEVDLWRELQGKGKAAEGAAKENVAPRNAAAERVLADMQSLEYEANLKEAAVKGYGKLYAVFGGGREGLHACAAGAPPYIVAFSLALLDCMGSGRLVKMAKH